jgi:hypothetical protein
MTTLHNAYRAARADQTKRATAHPGADYWPGRARDALRAARYAIQQADRRTALPLNLPAYGGDTAETPLPGGDVLTIRIEHDDDMPLENVRITWARRFEAGPWRHCHDGWVSRDGLTIYGSNRSGERYIATVGTADAYDFPAFLRDARGYRIPRHLRHRYARASVMQMADRLRAVMNDQEPNAYGFVIELRNAGGRLLDSNALWGIDDLPYALEEAESTARAMIAQRAKALRVDLIGARADGSKAREQFAALRDDLRRFRGSHAPSICAVLNGELQRLRDQVTNAFTTVRRLSATLDAYKRAGVIVTEARA